VWRYRLGWQVLQGEGDEGGMPVGVTEKFCAQLHTAAMERLELALTAEYALKAGHRDHAAVLQLLPHLPPDPDGGEVRSSSMRQCSTRHAYDASMHHACARTHRYAPGLRTHASMQPSGVVVEQGCTARVSHQLSSTH
jgi:hypothetical protein